MKDVQKKLYDLLKKFDKICKDNDVEYYLAGGSALGAVRHKGFLLYKYLSYKKVSEII